MLVCEYGLSGYCSSRLGCGVRLVDVQYVSPADKLRNSSTTSGPRIGSPAASASSRFTIWVGVYEVIRAPEPGCGHRSRRLPSVSVAVRRTRAVCNAVTGVAWTNAAIRSTVR